jgi:hypothetical protein
MLLQTSQPNLRNVWPRLEPDKDIEFACSYYFETATDGSSVSQTPSPLQQQGISSELKVYI